MFILYYKFCMLFYIYSIFYEYKLIYSLAKEVSGNEVSSRDQAHQHQLYAVSRKSQCLESKGVQPRKIWISHKAHALRSAVCRYWW